MAEIENKKNEITPEEKQHMHDVVLKWIGDVEKEEKKPKKLHAKKIDEAAAKVAAPVPLAKPIVKPKPQPVEPKIVPPAPISNPFATIAVTEAGYAAPKEIIAPSRLLFLPRPHLRLLPTLYKIALACFATIVIAAVLCAYFKKHDYPYRVVLSFVPIPYASVGVHVVYLGGLLAEADAVYKFSEQQNIPETSRPKIADIRDQVAKTALRRAAAEALADQYSVRVTNADIEAATEKLVAQAGSKQTAEDTIEKLWGWSLREYQRNVIEPYLLKQKLSAALAEDPLASRLIPPGSDSQAMDNYLDTVVQSRARIYMPLK